jgi:hypothetical protein
LFLGVSFILGVFVITLEIMAFVSGKPSGLVMLVVVVSVLVLFASSGVVSTLDWSSSSVASAEFLLSGGKDQFGEMKEEEESSSLMRRMLASSPFFISYGSLSADRIPCPAGSGRSYYTNNCYASAGPVRPYSRGCSAITHCARS